MIYYRDIAKQVALRANQLEAGDVAARELAFASGSLASTMDGTEVPPAALRSAILEAEAEIANMIGDSNHALFKAPLAGQSSAIASGAAIPSETSGGTPFVGSIDGFFDGTDNRPLTEMPEQVVTRANDNPGSFFKREYYYFARQGGRLLHTRTTAYARGTAWSRELQQTAYDTTFNQPANNSYSDSNVDLGFDLISLLGPHDFYTGLKVRVARATPGVDVLATPLAENTDYFIIALAASDEYQFASSLTNALTGQAINLTASGTGQTNVIVQEAIGGGISPIPQPLAALWICKALAFLPQEGWVFPEAQYYANLAMQKQADIMSGKLTMLQLPDMPVNTARVNPINN